MYADAYDSLLLGRQRLLQLRFSCSSLGYSLTNLLLNFMRILGTL